MRDYRKTGDYNTTPKSRIKRMVEQRTRDYDSSYDGDRGPGIPYDESNDPRPGQWDGRGMSEGRVGDYKRFVVSDGEGVRHSLFVSGCPFRCTGCFQPALFSFNAGFSYTRKLEDQIIEDLGYDYVQGLTILGGEPFLNTPMLLKLCRRVRREYGDSKDIWSWTGYTWEELHRDGESPDKLKLLSYVDILVDGRFMEGLKKPGLQFRGSSNQRIIDVKRSDTEGGVHIWDRLQDSDGYGTDHHLDDRMMADAGEA